MDRARLAAAATAFTLFASILVTAGCSKNAEPPAALSAPPGRAQAAAGLQSRIPMNQIAPDLPALPFPVANAPRPVEVVKAAYEFAARHPEVMNYIPCFCGCERPGIGHQGNHDCFVAERNAAGAVTEWEPHGVACTICIDVAYEARQLHATGASVKAIRTAIDARYSGHFPSSTPTPMPPGHGGHDRP